ncbi:MAG: thioesterase family protein [Pseudomonadota bacterium]
MTAAPFRSSVMTVKPEWIDYNGHLNMAYYNVLMDLGSDEAFAALGMGPDYTRARGLTTYSAEYRMQYKRELHEGDGVIMSLQLLDHDTKSFHFAQELHHVDGWLSARGEGLGLHIDQSGPRVAPMPEEIFAAMQAMRAAHAALPRPDWITQPIGIRRAGQPA